MAKGAMKLAISQILAEKRKKSSVNPTEAAKIAAKEVPKMGKKNAKNSR